MPANKTWGLRLVSLALISAFFVSVALAQSGRSWMNGIVFDQSDTQGLAGATVELIGDPDNERLRNTKLNTKTDEAGKYSFTNVPYGDYTFRVSAPGKMTYEIRIYIASDALTALHVKLKKKR